MFASDLGEVRPSYEIARPPLPTLIHFEAQGDRASAASFLFPMSPFLRHWSPLGSASRGWSKTSPCGGCLPLFQAPRCMSWINDRSLPCAAAVASTEAWRSCCARWCIPFCPVSRGKVQKECSGPPAAGSTSSLFGHATGGCRRPRTMNVAFDASKDGEKRPFSPPQSLRAVKDMRSARLLGTSRSGSGFETSCIPTF